VLCCPCRQYLPRAWAPKSTASTQTDSGELEAAQLQLEGLQLDSSQQQEQEAQRGRGAAAAQQPPALESRKSYSANPFAVSDELCAEQTGGPGHVGGVSGSRA
jgi:hypothetical protein